MCPHRQTGYTLSLISHYHVNNFKFCLRDIQLDKYIIHLYDLQLFKVMYFVHTQHNFIFLLIAATILNIGFSILCYAYQYI